MKKILSILLVVAMLFSMVATCFAEESVYIDNLREELGLSEDVKIIIDNKEGPDDDVYNIDSDVEIVELPDIDNKEYISGDIDNNNTDLIDDINEEIEDIENYSANKENNISLFSDEIPELIPTSDTPPILTDPNSITAVIYDDGSMYFGTGDSWWNDKSGAVAYYVDFGGTHISGWNDDEEKYFPTTPWADYRLSITSVTFVNEIHPTNISAWFCDFQNLENFYNGENLYLDMCTNARYAFENCLNIEYLDATNWGAMDKITDATSMFKNCEKLKEFRNAGIWTFEKNSSFSKTFERCKSLSKLDAENGAQFNTSKVSWFTEMFNGCESLQNIDFSNWDVSKSDSFYTMFQNCKNMTSIDLSTWQTKEKLSDKAYENMFCGCLMVQDIKLGDFSFAEQSSLNNLFHNCVNLQNLEWNNLDVSDVKSFAFMFYNCLKIEGISNIVYSFNMSNAEDISFMFQWVSEILPVHNWDVSKVKNMESAFNCANITDVSNWRPISLENMANAFYHCKINGTDTNQTIDFSGWECPNVKKIDGAFEGFPSTRYDMSGINISQCKSLNNVFKDCSKATIIDIADWRPENTESMSLTFSGCELVPELDFSKWRCPKLTVISGPFTRCAALKKIDWDNLGTAPLTSLYIGSMSVDAYKPSILTDLYLNGLDTSQVTSMSSMFSGFKNLKTLHIDTWDTSNVLWMENMFSYCSSLEKLDLSSFDTSKVNTGGQLGPMGSMYGMFRGCFALNEINLDGWNTSNVKSMYEMFRDCSSLQKITLGEDFIWAGTNHKLRDDVKWKNIDTEEVYEATKIPSNVAATYVITYDDMDVAILYEDGYLVFQHGDKTDQEHGEVIKVFTGFLDKTYNSSNLPEWANYSDKIEIIYFKDEIVLNENASCWFAYLSQLKSVQNLKKLNMSNVKYASNMFFYCTSLTDFKIQDLDLSSLENAGSMFSNTGFIDLDFSNLYMPKLKSISGFLNNCINLRTVNMSNLNIETLENLGTPPSIFWGCSSLEEVDISNANMKGLYNVGGFFNLIPVKKINASNINLEKCTSLSGFFSGLSNLEYLDLSNLNVSNATSFRMFGGCNALKELKIDGLKSNTTNIDEIFKDLRGLESIEITDWDTPNLNSVQRMFDCCIKLSDINISGLKKIHLSSASGMFSNCSSLKELDLSEFNFSGAILGGILSGTTSLESVDLSNTNLDGAAPSGFLYGSAVKHLNMSNASIKNIAYFGGLSASYLETVDISNVDASGTANFSGCFSSLSSLKSINLQNANLEDAEDFRGFLFGCISLEDVNFSNTKINAKYYDSMFAGCTSIKKLDLSSFNIPDEAQMNGMFSGANSLEEITLGEDFQFTSEDHNLRDVPWYNKTTGEIFTATTIPNNVAATYVITAPPEESTYTIEYWKQNLDDYEYTLSENDIETITTSTLAEVTAEEKDIDGFSLVNNENSITSGKVWADNSLVLKLYYDRNIYDVKFDEVSQDVKYEGHPNVPDAPDKTGYTFEKYIDENDNEVNENTVVTSPINATSQYNPNQYTVTFDKNGGVTDVDSIIVTYDSDYSDLPIPTKPGYEFAGWFTEIDEGDKISPEDTVKILDDITLYAHWDASNNTKYTVKYFHQNIKDNEYTLVDTICDDTTIGTTDATATIAPDEKIEGFYLNNENSILSGIVKGDGSLVLEVKYDRDTYSVTYKLGYETENDTHFHNPDVRYEDVLNIVDPKRTGYTFIKWVDENGNSISSEDEIKDTVNAIASWVANGYIITFDVNGGSLNDDETTKTVTYDDIYGELPTPTRPGYTFVGWFDGENEINSDNIVKITENTTLQAHWKGNQYVGTLDADGGTLPEGTEPTITLKNGKPYGEIPTPTKDGYVFDGWYVDDIKITPETIFEGLDNITLIAKYTKKSTSSGGYSRPTTREPFDDVKKNDWFHDDAIEAVDKGYIEELDTRKFGPENDMSRAATAKMFAKLIKAKDSELVFDSTMYPDVIDTTKYNKEITWCTNNVVMIGYGDGNFGPNDNLTREQFALILWRVYHTADEVYSWNENMVNESEKVSEWARDAVCWAVSHGLIQGNEKGELMPLKAISRAEACSVILRAEKNLTKQK